MGAFPKDALLSNFVSVGEITTIDAHTQPRSRVQFLIGSRTYRLLCCRQTTRSLISDTCIASAEWSQS
jgi:hypothetical protein